MPQADPDLWVTVRPHPRGPCLMSISGELDSTRILGAGGPGGHPAGTGGQPDHRPVAAHLLCSTGISVLIGAYRRSRAAGAVLALTGMNSGIARVFRVIGLDQVFSSSDTVEVAARALSS